MTEHKVRVGYMDSVELAHHLEHDPEGARIFPTVEALRQAKPCANPTEHHTTHCGIYKVEVKVTEVVQEEELGDS